MQIFICGTDTNIGKTIICSWLALHTKYPYFKPIQTGTDEGYDSSLVSELAGVTIYPEKFSYRESLSPHLAAHLQGEEININKITLPQERNLIIEGAGGVLVPINKEYLMIDLIKYLQIPVIIVASSRLGTINHTLLTLEALRSREIKILGVIVNGSVESANSDAIKFYGKTQILAELPWINSIDKNHLQNISLTKDLQIILAD